MVKGVIIFTMLVVFAVTVAVFYYGSEENKTGSNSGKNLDLESSAEFVEIDEDSIDLFNHNSPYYYDKRLKESSKNNKHFKSDLIKEIDRQLIDNPDKNYQEIADKLYERINK